MTEDFNYRMSTKYKDEFKNLITYENLYKTINEERKKTELSSFDAREIFTRRDKSGIFNKLKNQLHFYIKDYNKSDEEKFNILKLMYFIINTNKYSDTSELKSVSIIDLMAKPTLEHTDKKILYMKNISEIVSMN